LEPEWIERLLRPLLRDGNDFILPVYRRHKFDGLLIRNLIYPMARAIYGCSVREPYPADFAFSVLWQPLSLARHLESEQGQRAPNSGCVGGSGRGIQSSAIVSGPKTRPEDAPST